VATHCNAAEPLDAMRWAKSLDHIAFIDAPVRAILPTLRVYAPLEE
jgi:hypothetical protein